MTAYKAVLFDVDGVLIQQPKLFSEIYCERYDKNLNRLLPFYSSREFLDSSIGKYDLKQAIVDHSDKWQWTGNVSTLLDEWFEAENFPNTQLLEQIEICRANGMKVYIVTQQEKYRANFLKNVVFKDMFDGFFASCDLGLHKDTAEFWQEVLNKLGATDAHIVAYFDDRQSLVDLARSVGIDGFLYSSVEDVAARLS